MRLYYWVEKSGIVNFGDDLNPWLWKRLLPYKFNEKSNIQFIGIGTLLNECIPKADKTLVFGSGVGYGKSLPLIDDSWHFYFVRGPRSAHALGLDDSAAITDPAILLHQTSFLF